MAGARCGGAAVLVVWDHPLPDDDGDHASPCGLARSAAPQRKRFSPNTRRSAANSMPRNPFFQRRRPPPRDSMGLRTGVEDHQPPDPCIGEIAMRSICLLIAAILPLGGWELNLAHGQESKGAKIAVFALDRPVTEAPGGDEFPFGPMGTEAFKDLVARIKKTVQDDQVSRGPLALRQRARLQPDRRPQRDGPVKAAGDHLHADSLSMSQYVLASGVVDRHRARGSDDRRRQARSLTCEAARHRRHARLHDLRRYKSWRDVHADRRASRRGDDQLAARRHEQRRTDAAGAGLASPPVDRRRAVHGGRRKGGHHRHGQFRQDFSGSCESKYGSGVEFDKQYGKKKRDRPLLAARPDQALVANPQGPSKAASRKPAVAIVYVDRPILPGKPQPSLRLQRRLWRTDPQGGRQGRRRFDQGRSRVNARRIGDRQRDHPRRHAAGQGDQALAVSMGNVAAAAATTWHNASDTIFAEAGTIPRSAWSAASSPRRKCGDRHRLEAVQARRECRHAQLG